MNKIALGAAIAAISLTIPAAASAQKVGNAAVAVVNSERIFRECTACVSAQGQIQTQLNSARQRAQQLGQPIQTEAQSIEQAARAARAQQGAARTTAEAALQQRAQALQQRQATAGQEIQRLEQNVQSTQANVVRQINERLNPIISQVMERRGANVAVDVAATLAHSPSLDITNDVLAALNQALPSVTVAPLPQQQQPAPVQPQQPTGR
ncbi:MAG: OmpH family outer membrane protein [Sphingosinicella sp.]|nr:OmpH family outer membrane protein [Sphingosinicella sp.]